MKNVIASLAILGVSGCASCQPSAAPAGIPMAGMSTTTQSTGSPCDACAAFGWRWETVSFSIPKPKMYSIPKPVAGPQVIAIPMMPAAMPMQMAAPMMAPQPVMAPTQAPPQNNTQQPPAGPAKTTEGCGDSCTGCGTADIGTAELEECVRALTNQVEGMQARVNGRSLN